MVIKSYFLTYDFNQNNKVLTVVFTTFNVWFLLSLINVINTHFLSLLTLFYWQS